MTMKYVFRIELLIVTLVLLLIWLEGLAIYLLAAVTSLSSGEFIESVLPVIVTLLIVFSFYSFRVIFQVTWHGLKLVKLTKLQIISTVSLFLGLVSLAFVSPYQYWLFAVVILGFGHLWYLAIMHR